MKEFKFHLKCIRCGKKDIRPINGCGGTGNPVCGECGGIMITEEINLENEK